MRNSRGPLRDEKNRCLFFVENKRGYVEKLSPQKTRIMHFHCEIQESLCRKIEPQKTRFVSFLCGKIGEQT